ncbi:uncharacterized protein M6B38_142540 [Iris pallida]|uniref:Uncharacterized protein n=1 Tax=Iris pallida TaxID=29817 RepID=A0AAX6FBG0_IRIPA|nr:uncharacterized protein M6B38_142540 [Iris pallida]
MEKEIEVRNLEGESIKFMIPPKFSTADLKRNLRDSFLPAQKSPNFHLFFKGCKLSLDSQIEPHQIKNGEFIVLVPFIKKTQQTSAKLDPSEEMVASSECCQDSLRSPAADSAWLDMMTDLSSLSDIAPPNCSSDKLNNEKEDVSMRDYSMKFSSSSKHKRKASSNPILHDIFCYGPKDVFHHDTSCKISQFVDSINCLTNSSTGVCLLLEEFVKTPDKDRCACPLWLKKLLKSFNLLNIFYAFFQMQNKGLTWNVIEEALKHPCSFGLDDVYISDVKNLSVLCPKVIIHGKHENMVVKPGSAIIIDTSSDHCESTKRRPAKQRTSTIVIALEKRWVAFKTHVGTLIKSSMERRLMSGSTNMLSLEELFTSLKDGASASENSEAKMEKSRALPLGCHEQTHLEPTEMVDHLRKGLGRDGQIVHVEDIGAKQAIYVDVPSDLSDRSKTALEGLAITRLYSHQADAIQAILLGKNVIVATSTSSGKSLCYNLPVLEALSEDLLACALYIFPTKALAQDQLRALSDLTAGLDVGLTIGVYDGDTSQEDRTWFRDNARLLITNPDMLHMSILPYHAKFERVLSNLRFIVIDETHVYKGAFGCNVALILRRLRRICSLVYGSDPSFIFSTATSANPQEHAMELANLRTLELVQNDGSPCGQKYFLLWNPPLRSGSNLSSRNGKKSVDRELCTRRSSPIMEASRLFAELIQHGLRCIAFCKTRKLSELVLCYTREILQETAPNLVDSICVYRGGYTPQDRRRIETDFFGGRLRGVAATNALELGIDVGRIDATLHLGFPGSVSSLWQQAGRSGRRLRPSLAIYVAFEGPLDQYFMKFPHKLFKRPVEHCQVDGQNQKVLEQHISCAALELPLCSQYDEKFFGPSLESAIMSLKSKGCLVTSSFCASSTKMWSYIGPGERPSIEFSIRATETEKYKVIDQLTNKVLEEIEESKAFFQVYEGAVYMHQGFTYLVKSLDLSEKVALCQKADLKYFTKTRDYTNIYVIGGKLAYQPVKSSEHEDARTTAQVNDCKVTTKWFGFHRILKSTNQIYDTVELYLPEFSYESQAVWIRVPLSIKSAVEMQERSFRAGLHAASHALLNVVPLYVMCNASDMSTECANPHETRKFPERLLLYDKHPGGIGITTQIQMLFGELLTAALELVSTCSCSSLVGCPNCVQALLCSEYNEVLDKKAAIIILEGVIESENTLLRKSREVL